MSHYQKYAANKDMCDSYNAEFDGDYSVDQLIDDLEETLDLQGKGYIPCIKKVIFLAKEQVILNKQLEEQDKENEKLTMKLKVLNDTIDITLNEFKALEKEYEKVKKELHGYKKGYERVKKHHKMYYDMYNTEHEKLKQSEEQDKQKLIDIINENKKILERTQEQYAEWVKLKNANQLYKGFMAHHVSQKLEHDLEVGCEGQVDISAGKWLSKFLQEKFYEEIIPEIIDEITDDNVYSGVITLEHIGDGCISYTYIDEDEDEDEDYNDEIKRILDEVEEGSNEEVRINKILHPEAFEDE